MSCIGVYKRNVISLQTTIHWLMFWNVGVLLDYAFYTLLTAQGEYFSPQTAFWIWNVKDFLLNEGLHFALPALLEVPDRLDREKMGKNKFYVRKPGILEPRRAEVLKAKTVKEEPSSLMLSARKLYRKVPSKLIKVAEYRGDYLPKFSMYNIGDKSLQNILKPELKDETGEPGKSEVSIQDMQTTPQKYQKGTQNDHLTERQRKDPETLKVSIEDTEKMPQKYSKGVKNNKPERNEPEKLELSIPRSSDEGHHLRRRPPFTVYCRNHNSFSRH